MSVATLMVRHYAIALASPLVSLMKQVGGIFEATTKADGPGGGYEASTPLIGHIWSNPTYQLKKTTIKKKNDFLRPWDISHQLGLEFRFNLPR